MKISFDIAKIEAILSSDFGETSLLKYVKEPNLTHIPPMKRRRLSKSAKALFASLSCFDIENTPIVFSSKKGEVNRCFEILKELSVGELISPTSFSLSVHNATSSQFSIFSKNSCEISAISAQNSLEYGLLDGFLKLDEKDEVVVVSHFEAINQEFLDQKHSLTLALLLKKGSTFSLEQIPKECQNSSQNSSIQFLKHVEQKTSLWQIRDKKFSWQWTYEKH